jgi:hypothetical protein
LINEIGRQRHQEHLRADATPNLGDHGVPWPNRIDWAPTVYIWCCDRKGLPESSRRPVRCIARRWIALVLDVLG